ncbi:hypothetical protein CHS0354_028972 [Potamilus streckersoni]|uniref:G-protein coupled receptors family 1 profile domain-containing protein n=1 Tax=Potamilus streckersoni TaxID=2493646 RepID=A0AAE0SAH4_9BIVA|nr:hypothetical protein CHS0354_028972 [Potamilus streckersoni]
MNDENRGFISTYFVLVIIAVTSVNNDQHDILFTAGVRVILILNRNTEDPEITKFTDATSYLSVHNYSLLLISSTMISSLDETSRNKVWTLQEINDEYFNVLIPAVVILVGVMTIGIAGNSLVLYIFKCKYKPSNHRCFILCLATIDLLFDVFGIPFMIAAMRHRYVFYNVAACKAHRFINNSFATCSGLTVMIIAIERYIKICRPNGSQISNNMARGLCFLSGLIGVLLAFPSVVLYGQSTVETKRQNITGIECFTQNKYKNSPFPLIYKAFLAICFIVTLVIICICYILIVRRVKTHKANLEMTLRSSVRSGDLQSSKAQNDASNQVVLTKEDDSNKNNKLKCTVKTRKTMLFVVAATFIISYFPFVAITITFQSDKTFMKSWSMTEADVLEIFRIPYLLNSFANPIIYGFMDKKFRDESKVLLHRFINRGYK